jgi:trans-2,3-dihydro-3-hydroxyanthranilate isomerase
MANLRFHVVNAFGKQLFGGNPAAVFPNANGINETTMQSIARQLNLVETVFVTKNDTAEADYTFRYFTPNEELPVAGHPSIAAWLVLATTNEICFNDRSTFFQKNKAGIQEIQICKTNGKILVTMKQPLAKFHKKETDFTLLADALGVSQGEFNSELPIQSIDTGLGHLIVPMRSLKSLMKIKRNIDPLKKYCQAYGAREVQAFSFETNDPNLDLHTRNLCPRDGAEDPACGVGNGALACYLHANYFKDRNEIELNIEQGYIVNMPSIVNASVKKTKDGSFQAYVGGVGIEMIVGDFYI